MNGNGIDWTREFGKLPQEMDEGEFRMAVLSTAVGNRERTIKLGNNLDKINLKLEDTCSTVNKHIAYWKIALGVGIPVLIAFISKLAGVF